MKRTGRRILITLGIILAVLVAAAVVLRLVFTRDRLVAMILPRAEKALGAEIEVGDVSVQFPFGFGVAIEDLKFQKDLGGGKEMSFSSEKVDVKASLASLIRRRPRLSAVNISRGFLRSVLKEGTAIELKGINSSMSVDPMPAGYRADVRLNADSLLMTGEDPPALRGAAGIYLGGVVNTAAELTDSIGSAFPESSFEGELRIPELIMSGKSLAAGVVVSGFTGIEGRELFSEDTRVSSEYGGMTLSYRLVFDSEMAPEFVEFKESGRADLADFSEFMKDKGIEAAGGVGFELRGKGRVAPLAGLAKSFSSGRFREADNPIPGDFSLEGRLEVENSSFKRMEPPVSVTGLDMTSVILGNDINDIEASFNFDGTPFEVKGAADNILPALAEMASVYLSGGLDDISPSGFGQLFDGLKVDSRISLDISGGAVDAGRFLPAGGLKEGKKVTASGAPQGKGREKEMGAQALLANPAALMALKSSVFTVRLAELSSPYGDLSSLSATVKADRGMIVARPLEAEYAGGKINSSALVDLKNLDQITTSASFSASGVKADRAISRFTEAGNIFRGVLDLSGTGRINLAPGIDPLNSLHARYSVDSKSGVVDFSSYLSSISAATGLDLSRYKNYSYDSWKGDFIVSAGKVIIDDWKMEAKSGNILAAGNIGLDGVLNCRAKIIIPPAVQRDMKDLRKYRDLADLFRDESGNLVFPLDIGGTAKSPKVSLDQSGAKKKAEEKVLEELKKKAADKLKDLFD